MTELLRQGITFASFVGGRRMGRIRVQIQGIVVWRIEARLQRGEPGDDVGGSWTGRCFHGPSRRGGLRRRLECSIDGRVEEEGL